MNNPLSTKETLTIALTESDLSVLTPQMRTILLELVMGASTDTLVGLTLLGQLQYQRPEVFTSLTGTILTDDDVIHLTRTVLELPAIGDIHLSELREFFRLLKTKGIQIQPSTNITLLLATDERIRVNDKTVCSVVPNQFVTSPE